MSDRSSYPLALALELTSLGAEFRAKRHRREHPEATEDDVEAAVAAWLAHRPGAEFGDAEGRPVDFYPVDFYPVDFYNRGRDLRAALDELRAEEVEDEAGDA